MLDDLIKALAEEVFAKLGRPCKPIFIRLTKLAETKDGTSGDYDRAGEWQIQCGTDKPFLLSLTNAETKDPATREEKIRAAILRCIS